MPATPNSAVPVVVHGRGTIQVAPGHFARRVVDVPATAAPAAGVFRWVPVGDGTFKPCAVIHQQFVKLAAACAAFGIDAQILRRLCVAGFIASRQPSPRNWQVDIGSLSRHMEAVEKDRKWWTADRVRKFNEAL